MSDVALDKSKPWYSKTLYLPPSAAQLLQEYSSIQPDDVESHVLALRDQAWAVFPYPCVGEFAFLDFNLCQRPSYDKVVDRLKSDPSARHLDVGCCLGQDIRKLVLDGVSSSQITAIEMQQGFIDLGYALFKDKDRLQTTFLKVNILDDEDVVHNLKGTMVSIHCGLVLHLFNPDEQKKVLVSLLQMLVPEGGILLGHCVAHADGILQPSTRGKMTMRHNVETWKAIITELQEETGFALPTRAELIPFSTAHRYASWREEGRMLMAFEKTVIQSR